MRGWTALDVCLGPLVREAELHEQLAVRRVITSASSIMCGLVLLTKAIKIKKDRRCIIPRVVATPPVMPMFVKFSEKLSVSDCLVIYLLGGSSRCSEQSLLTQTCSPTCS